MNVIFVRHGKDDDRYRGGWSDLDLLPEGVSQAKRLAAHFKENADTYQITHIVSSDLRRAMTTAQYISSTLGLTVQPEPALREMNNGNLAGMLNAAALEQYPGLFFSTLNMDESYPNEESPNEFYARIRNWFALFCTNRNSFSGNVLVVTHGGVINILYHLVKGLPWSNRGDCFKASHCGIHILNLDTMQFEKENETDFLLF